MRWNRATAIRDGRFSGTGSNRARSEYFPKQAGQLKPLGVGTAAADGQRMPFQPLQGFDFDAQLRNRAGGGGLIENFRLGGLDFNVGRLVKVLYVFIVKGRQ